MSEEGKRLKERTREFALRTVRLYAALPKSTVAQVLGKQLLRAGTSVGAHYREGTRSRSNAEFVSKLGGALQELEESRYWLELLEAERLVPETALTPRSGGRRTGGDARRECRNCQSTRQVEAMNDKR